jgi:DNA-binding GntR family transcriptional regulator
VDYQGSVGAREYRLREPSDSAAAAHVQSAYRVLRQRILMGEFPPGQQLPCSVLAEELRLSRKQLGTILQQLVAERLLVPDRRGFRISSVSIEEIRQLCELRRIVESEVAALAARRSSPQQTFRLLQRAELAYTPGIRQSYARYVRANRSFHLELARTTGNPRLAAVVASVLRQIERPLLLSLDYGLPARAATAEHLEVIEAVRRRRPELASRLMATQITAAEHRMLSACAAYLR